MKTLAEKAEAMNEAMKTYVDLKTRTRELLASIDNSERDNYGLLTGKSRDALVQYTELVPQQDRVSRKLRRLIHDVARTLDFGKLRLETITQMVSTCHQLTNLSMQ